MFIPGEKHEFFFTVSANVGSFFNGDFAIRSVSSPFSLMVTKKVKTTFSAPDGDGAVSLEVLRALSRAQLFALTFLFLIFLQSFAALYNH